MFGLSTRETLSRAIANACQNNKDVYKNAVKKKLPALADAANDEEAQKILIAVRKEYLTKVFEDVIQAFNISDTTLSERLRLAILSPELCGLSGSDIDNGTMAGTVYAICYWVLKNKEAKSGDCIAMNHYQNNIMESVLKEIQSEH